MKTFNKKKALIVASVGGFIDFEKNDIKILKNLGYEVVVACNTEGWESYLRDIDVRIECVHFSRNPYSKATVKAYRELKRLIEKEKPNLIHCHTPIAGILTRIAARKERKSGTKVIYTAHGFHFYKGAPMQNWVVFYNVEKMCSKFTDVIITINREDYDIAVRKFKARKIEYVPGVGIDINSIRQNKAIICKDSLGIKSDDKMIFSVGELNMNKNHEVIIRAISAINDPKIHYYIAGVGELDNYLESLAKEQGLENQFHLLGYRKDIISLNKLADIFCLPSHREGLSVALMEAIAAGTKVACSNIRGNRDLAEDCRNVVLFDEKDVQDVARTLVRLLNKERVEDNGIEKYSIELVQEKMTEIYVELSK